ncbi:MAG: IPTL-CTERM sorting domain-containing protein [Casimicrobiaceae bacterium]
MQRPAVLFTSFALLLFAVSARAATITDCCDWASGWAFGSYTVAGAGTASATVEATGGNPGARLNITTVTPTGADTAYGTALLTTSTTAAPAAGAAFTLSLDVLSGAGGFGQGQGIQLLVGQAGSIYAQSVGITGFPLASFTTINFPGNFNAGAFTRISGAGPATPSFDGVTATTYGFAAGNNMSATLTQYYDNFRLVIPSIGGPAVSSPAANIPTLSEYGLVALGLFIAGLGMIGLRQRR